MTRIFIYKQRIVGSGRECDIARVGEGGERGEREYRREGMRWVE